MCYMEVLPVVVDRRQRWQGDSVKVAPTEAGLRHPILRLGGGRDAAGEAARESLTGIIEGLLPVEGVNVGLSPKADAQVLLESADAEHRPLVVAAEQGEGRSLLELHPSTS